MKKILLVVAVAVLALPLLTLASVTAGGPAYTLPAGEAVQGNLYAGGGTVAVFGSVSKDTMVAGGTVTLAGSSTANVMAAGGNVNVTGPVGQDLRVGGGTVVISSQKIGGELLAAGGNLNILDGVQIAGDTYLAGGRVEMNGNIGGTAKIGGGEVVINGTIAKDVTIRAKKVTLGPKAVINGSLNYQAELPATIDPAAKISGQTVFKKFETEKTAGNIPWVFFGIAWFMKLIASALAALVVFWIIGKHSKKVATLATEHFWGELLRGLIILVVMPIAIVLLFVTVIGWYLALIGVFAYVAILLMAGVFSVFTTTGLLQKYAFKKPVAEITWPKLLLGALVLFVIAAIPFAGWIVCLGIFLASLGSLLKMNFTTIRESRAGEQ